MPVLDKTNGKFHGEDPDGLLRELTNNPHVDFFDAQKFQRLLKLLWNSSRLHMDILAGFPVQFKLARIWVAELMMHLCRQ